MRRIGTFVAALMACLSLTNSQAKAADPGLSAHGGDEDVELVESVAACGGGVGADRGELLGAGQGAHAAGHLDQAFLFPYL